MPREDFERNLKGLQEDVVQLSSRVEKAIFKSIEALKERDITASQKVVCLLYTSPSPRDKRQSRMPSSA